MSMKIRVTSSGIEPATCRTVAQRLNRLCQGVINFTRGKKFLIFVQPKYAYSDGPQLTSVL